MAALFIIVGKNEPVYEAELGAAKVSVPASVSVGPFHSIRPRRLKPRPQNQASASSAATGQQQQQQQDETAHLNQFIMHSSLDMLEKAMWTNGMMCVGGPCVCVWGCGSVGKAAPPSIDRTF